MRILAWGLVLDYHTSQFHPHLREVLPATVCQLVQLVTAGPAAAKVTVPSALGVASLFVRLSAEELFGSMHLSFQVSSFEAKDGQMGCSSLFSFEAKSVLFLSLLAELLSLVKMVSSSLKALVILLPAQVLEVQLAFLWV